MVTAIGSMASVAVIDSIRERWQTATVIGTDIYPEKWLAQSQNTDKFFQVPRADHPDYIRIMSEICGKHHIDWLIPLIDPEVDILALNRETFEKEGTIICISGTESIEKCRNKLTLYQTFKDDGNVNVIPTYTRLEIAEKFHGYPLIIKPRKGRSSEGLQILEKRNGAGKIAFQNGTSIIQPYYDGEIFTVDIVRDFFGNCVSIPRKEYIRNKIGAGLTVEITNNKTLEKISATVTEKLNIYGAVNIEFLCFDGSYYLLDVNPRFSAGVSFTIRSGFNIVKNHMLVMMGNELEPRPEIVEGIYMKIYTDVVKN